MALTTIQKNRYRDEIRLLAINLPKHTRSPHYKCPACLGGGSGEHSFVIYRTDTTLFYRCYRAKCHFQGVISSKPSERDMQSKDISQTKSGSYPWSTRKLTAEEMRYLTDRYELSEESVVLNRVKHNIPRGKYVFPLMDIEGREIGILDRDFREGYTKALNTWFSYNVPHIHFPQEINAKYHKKIFLVEDVISAIKVNQLDRVACASIMGTYISADLMKYLASITDAIVFMLDPDAFNIAKQYRNKYNVLFKQPIGIVQLRADPKDTPIKTLEDIVF